MTEQLLNILMAFVVSTVFTWLAMPLVIRISVNKKLFDVSGGRKIHKGKVPRLGGIIFMPAIVLASLAVLALGYIFPGCSLSEDVLINSQPILFLSLAVFCIYFLGVADDIFNVKYRYKFLVQIIAAACLAVGGFRINTFAGFLGIGDIEPWLSYPLSMLVVVFIINALNLIDGIDGLCACLSDIALLIYLVTFLSANEYIGAVICIATIGTTIPFLRYNIWGKRRKTFMGDTGSMTLGILIAAMGMWVLNILSKQAAPCVNPMIVFATPILIPSFDVVRVYLYRLRNHKNPFLPDKNHIHHRCLDRGLGQHTVLVALCLLSLGFMGLNILLEQFVSLTWIVACDTLLWITLTYLLRPSSNP